MAEETPEINDEIGELDDELAEGEEQQLDEDGMPIAPPKKKKKKKLFILLLPVLLVIGGGVGLYFTGAFDKMFKGEEEVAIDVDELDLDEDDKNRNSVFYDLPEMTVNLNTPPEEEAIYLKVKISLEIEKQVDVPFIEEVLPRIIDSFQIYLRELRPGDLQGAIGIYRLREELLFRINNASKPAVVLDVLFKEILIQ